MIERYDINRDVEEASEMKYRVESGKAKDYVEAEKQIDEMKWQLRDIKRELNPGKEESFLNGAYQYARVDFPKAIRDKIILAILPHTLGNLKDAYSKFKASPDRNSLMDLENFTSHTLIKVAYAIGEDFPDIGEDFSECKRLVLNTMIAIDEKEENFERDSPSVDKICAKIEEILKKYSADERFSHDPYKLVAEIREDLAKYKAEWFPAE